MRPLAISSCLLLLLLASSAAEAAPINRTVLAVIDSSEATAAAAVYGDAVPGGDSFSPGNEDVATNSVIAQYLEMPLNHLGYMVEYVDVTKRLPDDEEMRRYEVILSWFLDNHLKGAADYGRWITRQLARGKRLIVFDEFGFELDESFKPIPREVLRDFFRAFAVSYDPGDATESPLLIEMVSNDPAMTEFERDLKGGLTSFRQVAPTDRGATVFLKLRRKDTGSTGDAVVIHSKGGYVLSGYELFRNPGDLQTRWRVDPFRFFARALRADFPKPDVTTLNGSRIFFSHIDGDGIANRSRLEGGKTCGEEVYERILTAYPLPASASVIVGDITSRGGGERTELAETVRKIFALPNVEAASHGWAHPLVWSEKRRKMALKIPGYVYSPQKEIGDSIAYINDHLVPAGKATDLFFWTGDCRPDHEALAFVASKGLRGINGGDTQFTAATASTTFVAPLFRHVGDLLQRFAADANEIVYTNIWSGPYYGFRYAIETFRRTESPVRLRPIDLYYHYFSMDRESAAAALREVVDWTISQDIAPIFTSQYLEILKGFLSTTIEQTGPGRWRIASNGALRTIRFDGEGGTAVDLAQSKGVLGFLPHQGSLYVHLDNGEQSQIVLAKGRPSRPYLVQANGQVRNWTGGGGVRFELLAIGRAQFTIGGLGAGRHYAVRVGDRALDVQANGRGEISAVVDVAGEGFAWTAVAVSEGA